MTAQIWARHREDDGAVIEGLTQTVTLYADRVEYDDGTVVTECPWNVSLPLDVYLRSLDYEPLSVTA